MSLSVKVRKKQPALTRRAILDAAGGEFANHGYAGAAIGTIVENSGLTKGAVFHHFADKQALALAWIREVLATAIDQDWVQTLGQVESLAGLKAFCREKAQEMRVDAPLGALVSFGAGIPSGDPVMREELHILLDRLRSAISGVLESGKAASWIHLSIQPSVEARFMVGAFCGFAVTARLTDDAVARAGQAAAMEAYLDTLRPE